MKRLLLSATFCAGLFGVITMISHGRDSLSRQPATASSALPARASLPAQTALRPPATSHSHPISKEPPISDGPASTRPMGVNGPRSEPPLPLSKVAADSTGNALFSRDANRSLCVAVDSRTQRTWLGSAVGVKLIDGPSGTVSHFGPSEGLPEGHVVAIGADGSGEAWCIVAGRADAPSAPGASPPGRIAFQFCAFVPSNGRWTSLRTITPAVNGLSSSGGYYNGGFPNGTNQEDLLRVGRPRVAVGATHVTFTLGIAGAAEDVAVYQWDRRERALQTVPWDAGLRADNPQLFSTSLTVDDRDGGLWLGTNAGLLYRALPRGTTSESRWERVLEDQVIGESAAAPRDGGVWVVTTARQNSARPFARPTQPQPGSWKLHRVSGTKANQVRDETPPPAPSGTAANLPNMPRGFPGTGTNSSVPVAVTIDENGAVWLTQQARGRQFGFPGNALDSWWRRDAKPSGWTRFEMYVAQGPPFGSMMGPRALRQIIPSGEVYDNVTLSQLADAAVRPLALRATAANGTNYPVSYGGYFAGGPEDQQAAFWLRRRFPTWICVDDLTGKLAGSPGTDPFVRGYSSPYGIYTDPYGPKGMVWTMDLPGTTLLHLPETAIPADLRRARTQGYYQTSTASEVPASPTIERYPLPAGRTVQVRPAVEALISGGTGLYLVLQNNGVMAYNAKTGTFSRVPLPRSGIYPSRQNPPVTARDGSIIISSPNSSDSQVLNYDLKNGTFRVLAEPGFGGRVFAMAPNGGLWITTRDYRILFQAPGADSTTPLPDDFKGPQSGSVPMTAATGYVAWTLSTGDSLVGYDVERKRRTPPLDLRSSRGASRGALKVVSDTRGGAYVAIDNEQASVYRYDRERNAWEAVAPPVPAPPALPDESTNRLAPTVVSADDNDIWLVADARYLVRYDRRKKKWSAPVRLPLSLRGGYSSDNDQSVATAENGSAIYIGGRGGLWRYGKKDCRWTEKKLTVVVSNPDKSPANGMENTRLAALAPSPDSIFTIWAFNNGGGTFAARLDRRTKEWTLYDESRGFPERNMGMRLVGAGAGSAAWLIQGSRTYFFDARRNLWRLAFGNTKDLRPQNGEQIPDAALAEPNPNREVDTENYRVVDIATDSKTGDSFVLCNPQSYTAQSRSVVFRCDGAGKIVGISTAPAAQSSGFASGNSLFAERGSVLVATSLGVYRAFGPSGATWDAVPSPKGLTTPTAVTNLRRDAASGGLYVMNYDTVAYWKKE